MTKGKQICVEGHLKQDRWEKDGQKQSRITIQADNCYLLGGKSEGGADSGGNQQPQQRGYAENYADAMNDGEDFPEDIPF